MARDDRGVVPVTYSRSKYCCGFRAADASNRSNSLAIFRGFLLRFADVREPVRLRVDRDDLAADARRDELGLRAGVRFFRLALDDLAADA